MKLGWLCCLLLGIAACTVPRPDDAWDPPEDAEVDEDDGFDEFDPPPPTDEEDDDARVDTSSRDASTDQPVSDGDAPDDPDEPDTGELVTDDPLGALDGKRFLMRIDVYAHTIETSSIVTLELRNRVSNLFWVEFELEGDKLTSKEVLCDQVYAHDCVDGCDTWETRVHPDVLKMFSATERAVTRSYDFDDESRQLTGSASMPLGFDEKEGDRSVPRDDSDSRLWKVGSAGLGVYTDMKAVVGKTLKTNVNCQVSSVQRYATTLSGELPANVADLEGATFELDADGSDADVVAVDGIPRTQCTVSNFQNVKPNQEASTLRFKAFEGDGCPSNFESKFPANPDFMF